MRKLHVLAVALFAVCALSAVAAASASALETLLADWLVGGVEVTGELLVEVEGELLLQDLGAPGEPAVLCSGLLDGFLLEDGEDLVTELLSLNGTAISLTALSGTALECENEKSCEGGLVWAVHLPWTTLLELVVDGTEEFFVVLLTADGAGNPGWYVQCSLSLGEPEDECTAEQGAAELMNAGVEVEALFTEAFTTLMGLKLAKCTANPFNSEKGDVESDTAGLFIAEGGVVTANSLT